MCYISIAVGIMIGYVLGGLVVYGNLKLHGHIDYENAETERLKLKSLWKIERR